MHHLLTDVAVSIFAAAIFGTLAFWFKQPTILGYLVAGAFIGPTMGLSLISDTESVEIISELGLILLLFIIGLEINPRQLMSSGKQLAYAGVGQFLVCAALGMGVFTVIAISPDPGELDTLYLALLCGLSSTAVVVKLLYDKFELDTRAGRITLGILIVQDLWAILVLALQPNFSNPSLYLVAEALVKAAALLSFGFFVSKFFLKPLFGKIAKSPEIVVVVSIGWCVGLAHLAGLAGLSREMGALIAGLSIGSFPYSIHVTAKTLPLRDFFLTLFFMSLGMKIVQPQTEIIVAAIFIVVFVILTRFLSVYPLLLLAGGGNRTAFIASLNLAQVSEFALVIGALGVTKGHIRGELVSVLMYAMAISSVLSSYAIKYSHPIYRKYAHFLAGLGIKRHGAHGAGSHSSDDESGEGMSAQPIVLLGYHHGAREIVESITENAPEMLERLVVVDFNTEALKELKKRGIHAIFGDLGSFDTLAHAHLEDAQAIIVTIPDLLLKGTNNESIVQACRLLAPEAVIYGMADSRAHAQRLQAAGASSGILFYGSTADGIINSLRESFSPGEIETV